MILFIISLFHASWKDTKVAYLTTFLVALTVLLLVLVWSMFELFLEVRKREAFKVASANVWKVKV